MPADQPVVVVTGAAGRLASFVLDRFAGAEYRRAAIVLNQAEADTLSLGADDRIFMADCTDEAAVTSVFAEVAAHFGRVDALVHTVGTWGASPLLETSLEEWRTMMDLNLTSAFLCFREAARQMRKLDRPGTLIGMASGQGADRGAPEQAAYSAAKAGLVRLVESAAAELQEGGITVHAIAPSMILVDDEAGQRGVHAREIARLCLELCGPQGSALSGSVLRAYGTLRP